MANTFQVGDVVELKSGSPPMTVEQVGDQPQRGEMVRCTWFEGEKAKRANFRPEQLQKV